MKRHITEFPYPYNLILDIYGDVDQAYEELDNDRLKGLEHALQLLTDREQAAIHERYYNDKTLETVGGMLQVGTERARQIIDRALLKLKHPSRLRYIEKGYKVASGELRQKEIARYEAEIEAARQAAKRAIEGYKKIVRNPEAEWKDEQGYNMPIENLEISVRSYNSLRRYGVKTIGDILAMDNAELHRIRNIGLKSCDEIFGALDAFGFMKFDCGETFQIYDFQFFEQQSEHRRELICG